MLSQELIKVRVSGDQDKFLVQEYFVCNAWGHVVTREPPEHCQVCGAVRKAFHKVI